MIDATPHQNLGLQGYRDAITAEQFQQVLDLSGVDIQYFRTRANYSKPCTPKMFERIEQAARKVTPGILPDYDTCTRSSVREAALAAKATVKDAIRAAERNAAAARSRTSL
jgi:hypothetical protein